MDVARIIVNLAGNFCNVDMVYNPTGPQDEILKGSVDNAIVIHMAKEPSRRDGFVSAMGNVFSVRRDYDLPPGSPSDLVWIQIGRGYPWRKDNGKPGTEF